MLKLVITHCFLRRVLLHAHTEVTLRVVFTCAISHTRDPSIFSFYFLIYVYFLLEEIFH